jgi:multisite-specific tRNA:(cytosine-C5)-methyltransferase
MQAVEHDGKTYGPPEEIPWCVSLPCRLDIMDVMCLKTGHAQAARYTAADAARYPGKLAWQLSAPKRIVRKSEPFKVFQRFLVGETEVVSIPLSMRSVPMRYARQKHSIARGHGI